MINLTAPSRKRFGSMRFNWPAADVRVEGFGLQVALLITVYTRMSRQVVPGGSSATRKLAVLRGTEDNGWGIPNKLVMSRRR
jgi:hypothetical protein